MAYSYTERKRIRKSFGKRDSVLEVPYLLQMQKDAYTAFLQADVAPSRAHRRGPAGRLRRGLPDRLAQRFCRDEVHRIQPGQARLRRARVPDPRPDLRLGRARQGAADHLRPRVLHAAVQGGQGGQGAGGLHGRSAAHDRQGLLHHQRHRARDRLAAAPLAGRVLRARQGQDAQLGQAAVLGPHHSLPRLLAGLRVRPEGHPVLPRRPPPQDAGDDPAQGHRPDARVDPGELLRQRQLPPDGQRRADGVRARAPARRSGPLRHHRQVRQGGGAQGQARHRAPHPRAGAVRHHPHQRAGRLPGRPRGGPHHRRSRTPARSSPRPTTS